MSHLQRFAVASLTLFVLAACSAPSARVYGGYTQMEMSGNLGLTPTIAGITIDPLDVSVENDLQLGEASGSLYGRIELDAGPARITGSAFQFDSSGTGTLSANFGDITANTTVDSEFNFSNGKVALTFDLLDFGYVRISPGVGVDVFDLEARVTDQTTGLTESITELLPVPMVFVQAEADLGYAGVVLDVGGMKIDLDDAEGTFFDIEALAFFRVHDNVELFGGYRWISLDGSGVDSDQAYEVDLDFKGFVIGGGFKF